MDKNKKTIVGSVICLLPILIGSILSDLLPNNLHAQLGMGPNISKETMIFIIPILFFLLHLIVVFKPDWLNTQKSERRYWYIPLLTSILFIILFIWNIIRG